jgi:hypothetical protein
MLVLMYRITQYDIPEDSNLKEHLSTYQHTEHKEGIFYFSDPNYLYQCSDVEEMKDPC